MFGSKLPGRLLFAAVVCAAPLLVAGCSSVTSLLPDGLVSPSVDVAEITPASTPDKPEATKPEPTIGATVRASAVKPTTGKNTLARARELKANGKLTEAVALLEAASAAAPNDRQLLVEQGLMALEQGQMSRARTLLISAEAATDSDWRVVSGLGIAHSGLGDQVEARKSFNRALELSPGNPTVLNNLGLTYMLDGKLDQASTMLRRAAGTNQAKSTVSRNVAIVTALKGESAAPTEVTPPTEMTDSNPRIEEMGERPRSRAKSSAMSPPPSGLGRGVDKEGASTP